MRVVKKFGGTSVGTIEKIKNIAKYLCDESKSGVEMVVVVSAMGKTTDALINMAKEITATPNTRELDTLMSIGEQQTISLLSIAIQSLGVDAISLTGAQAGIVTSGIHTKSKISTIDKEKIEKYLREKKIVIVAGFQGINESGDITTLGRGGSDTSAVALAAALGCDSEIYTDVKGIYGVDPRAYKDAKKLDRISYEEMMEMANLGAGVMETRAVEIGKKYGVRIYVAETLGAETGTYICDSSEIIEKKVITGISINSKVISVNVEKISTYPKNVALLFSAMAKHGVNVDMISQNDVKDEKGSIAFSCPVADKAFVDAAFDELRKELPDIEVLERDDIAKVSLVGIGMISNFGVAARVFEVLDRTKISFHQCTTSEISISLIISKDNVEKFVEELAKEFSL